MNRDVMLIEPASSSAMREMFKEKYPYPPVGLLHIAAFLKLHGYTVHVVDMMIEDHSRQDFRRRLATLSRSPLAVGISLYTECFYEGIEVAALVRELFPETCIVAGGPHATFRPDEVLSYDCIDFVIRHEGESAMVELLEHLQHPQGLPVERIQSLAYRDVNGAVRSNPTRPFVTNLDLLPFPSYESVPALQESYKESFMFVSSPGCPGDCVFCASRAMSGKRYRFHSAEWVFSLAYEYFRRYGFNRMVFLDDTFTVHRKRAEAFCHYLLTAWPGSEPPRWACKSRVDRVSDEICALMSRAGCLSIHIGVESADQGVLDAIAKHIRLEQTFEAIRVARRHGLRVDCSFIIGHHADTRATIEKTILFAQAIRDHGIGTAAIGISTPFPGTRLFEDAEKLGITITTRNWRKYDLVTPVYDTQRFTKNDLRRALYFLEHESRRGKQMVGLTGQRHEQFRAKLDRLIAEIEADENAQVKLSKGGVQ
ncbi:MAG: radical SAM protein [Acidobacteria bacterium]|nr:MAG: radical SAM protein [Acidobacteriota bacterium]